VELTKYVAVATLPKINRNIKEKKTLQTKLYNKELSLLLPLRVYSIQSKIKMYRHINKLSVKQSQNMTELVLK